VSIRKGFITRSLGLKRSQEFSYAQQAAGTSGFFYFAGNCIYFENEHKRHSLFLCLNAKKGGMKAGTNKNYIVSVTLYVVCVNIKTLYIV